MPLFLEYIDHSAFLACPFFLQHFDHSRIICKVSQLGGENSQFQHNRPSNAELRMKILQSKT